MKSFIPNKSKKVRLYTDTKGTQEKYKDNGYWYKVNHVGAEGLAEELSSLVLSCSKLPESVSYIEYEQCMIGDKKGCRSANFLCDGENYVSFKILYKNETGRELAEDVFKLDSIPERFDYVVSFVQSATGLDVSEYLKCSLTLDAFILNPDRHYGNLGVIERSDGSFKYAPIFDNGQALGANYQITPPYMSLEDKINHISAVTLSGSFDSVIQQIGTGFTIDTDLLRDKLEKYQSNSLVELLLFQIDKYKNILDEKYIYHSEEHCDYE